MLQGSSLRALLIFSTWPTCRSSYASPLCKAGWNGAPGISGPPGSFSVESSTSILKRREVLAQEIRAGALGFF